MRYTLATLLLTTSHGFQMKLRDGCTMQLEYLENLVKDTAIADWNANPGDEGMDTATGNLMDEFDVDCSYFTRDITKNSESRTQEYIKCNDFGVAPFMFNEQKLEDILSQIQGDNAVRDDFWEFKATLGKCFKADMEPVIYHDEDKPDMMEMPLNEGCIAQIQSLKLNLLQVAEQDALDYPMDEETDQILADFETLFESECDTYTETILDAEGNVQEQEYIECIESKIKAFMKEDKHVDEVLKDMDHMEVYQAFADFKGAIWGCFQYEYVDQ